nr:zinc finger, CCHC-type [Tanacetum cinerariifolium]
RNLHLIFDEAEASGRETAAPEMPPPEEVSLATIPGASQAVNAVVAEPPTVRESRKRGPEGVDANAPPKSLRRDHTDRPSGVPADVSDPDPLAFADAPSHPPVDVARYSSQGIAVAEDPGSENASSPIEVGSPGSVYRPEWGVTNGSLLDTPEACQDLVDHAAPPGYFTELRHMPNDEFLWQYNSVESLEMRQAFADVVSAGVAKVGRIERCPNGCDHGCFIFGERYWGNAPQYIRDLRRSSSQLTIPVYPEVGRHSRVCTLGEKLSSIMAKFKGRGETLEDKVLVRKLLNSAPKKFLPIVATIEQYQDLDEMSFEEAVGRLTAHEERIKSQDTLEANDQDKLLMASSNNKSYGK